MSSQAPVRELQLSLCAVNKPQGCTIRKKLFRPTDRVSGQGTAVGRVRLLTVIFRIMYG